MKPDSIRCWAEIDSRALAQNIRFIRKKIGKDRRIIAVIKANGYGHGLGPVAGELYRLGVRHFGVASPEEAFEALAAAPRATVLLLSGSLPDEISEIIRRGI